MAQFDPKKAYAPQEDIFVGQSDPDVLRDQLKILV
jgi:hypothetical protein